MEGFRAKSGSARPNVYTDAGLEWLARRERREALQTLAFVWVMSAVGAVCVLPVVAVEVAIGVFGALGLAATVVVLAFILGSAGRTEKRRRSIRAMTQRVQELSLEEADELCDMLEARRRQALQVGGVGGSLSVVLMIPVVIMTSGRVAETLIGAAFVEALLMWVVLGGLRNIKRDFAQQRADTREFLAEHRASP